MSMTWTMLTSLSCLFTRDWMHFCSPVTSYSSPHDKPVSFQDVSHIGGPDQNSGVAIHFGSRGSVM